MTRTDALYAGPFYGPSDPEGRGPDKSPYLVGLKRALVRWTRGTGALKWQKGGNFNGAFNLALELDVDAFKNHKGIDTPKWVWGSAAHDALETAIRGGGAPKPFEPEEPAIDKVTLTLFEDAYDLKHPGVRDTQAIRASMAAYLRDMERYDSIWDYLQQRPVGSLGRKPRDGGRDDCSALCITAYYWARLTTGLFIPDPSGYAFTGYGNTVSIYWQNRDRKLGLSATFEVGDIALYGPWASRHATICRKRGTKDTAVFTSHGSSAGPNPTRLLYRDDLYAVVRPGLAPKDELR